MSSLALDPIPVTRLDQADPMLLEEMLGVVARVARTGAFTMGSELDAFEAEFAAYCGIDHAVGVSSGTEALSLALRALDIGPGDEVIVPTNSFIATAEAVSDAGRRRGARRVRRRAARRSGAAIAHGHAGTPTGGARARVGPFGARPAYGLRTRACR